MLVEFRDAGAQLDQRIDNQTRLAAGAGALADRLRQARQDGVTVPDSLLITLLVTPTFDPALGTLLEAQSSGRTSVIRNPDLRRLLSSWSGRALDAKEEEQMNLQLVQDELYPALAREVSIAHLMDHGGSWIAGTLSPELRESNTWVPVTPGLINFSKHRAQTSSRNARELSQLKVQLDSIVALIEASSRPR